MTTSALKVATGLSLDSGLGADTPRDLSLNIHGIPNFFDDPRVKLTNLALGGRDQGQATIVRPPQYYRTIHKGLESAPWSKSATKLVLTTSVQQHDTRLVEASLAISNFFALHPSTLAGAAVLATGIFDGPIDEGTTWPTSYVKFVRNLRALASTNPSVRSIVPLPVASASSYTSIASSLTTKHFRPTVIYSLYPGWNQETNETALAKWRAMLPLWNTLECGGTLMGNGYHTKEIETEVLDFAKKANSTGGARLTYGWLNGNLLGSDRERFEKIYQSNPFHMDRHGGHHPMSEKVSFFFLKNACL